MTGHEKQRVVCPVCGRSVDAQDNGRPVRHRMPTMDGRREVGLMVCSGSRLPEQETDRQRKEWARDARDDLLAGSRLPEPESE